MDFLGEKNYLNLDNISPKGKELDCSNRREQLLQPLYLDREVAQQHVAGPLLPPPKSGKETGAIGSRYIAQSLPQQSSLEVHGPQTRTVWLAPVWTEHSLFNLESLSQMQL